MPAPGDQSPTPAPSARARRNELFLGGLVFGVGVVSALAWAYWNASRTALPRVAKVLPGDARIGESYVGAKTCAECHVGEYAHFTRSGHAHTLRRAGQTPFSDKLTGVTVTDPEFPDVSWSYSVAAGKLTTQRSTAGKPDGEREVLEYAFGSGSHGMTFVSFKDRVPPNASSSEHRITFYPAAGKMDVTPGQHQPSDRPEVDARSRRLKPAEALECFDCHTTLTSSRGNKVLDPESLVPNVTCERCHGPGRAHVEAARRGESELKMPLGPRHGWTSDELVRDCGHCHVLPETSRSGPIIPENFSLVRFAPIGLMQSRCYQESKGALSCVSCHNPHAKTSTDRRAYEAVCIGCHQDSRNQTLCSVSPRENCLECHMPKRQIVSNGVFFTDHWILKRPK
jgi:hypothetical protein